MSTLELREKSLRAVIADAAVPGSRRSASSNAPSASSRRSCATSEMPCFICAIPLSGCKVATRANTRSAAMYFPKAVSSLPFSTSSSTSDCELWSSISNKAGSRVNGSVWSMTHKVRRCRGSAAGVVREHVDGRRGRQRALGSDEPLRARYRRRGSDRLDLRSSVQPSVCV